MLHVEASKAFFGRSHTAKISVKNGRLVV